MKQISVIILNWNGADLLRKYLPSVVGFSNPDLAEVIVADNGSTDNSLSILRSEFPTVQIIALPQNYGFAKGYNLAIEQINTKYCVLLNDDVRVTPGWLEPLYNYMQQHPEVAACQPKLLSDRQPSMFEYAGAAGGYLDKFGYPFCRGRIFDTVEEDHGQYDTITNIMWATGACLFTRTEVYQQAGGLDANFFAHMEEIDLCWRMRNMGYTLVCLPTSKVYHYGGASLAMGNPRKTKLNFRNSLLMLYKNLDKSQRNRIIFIRKCLDLIAILNFLAHGEFAHIKAIYHAHREASEMITSIYKYTSQSSYNKSLNQTQQFEEEKHSILWSYYVKRKKTFR